MRIKRQTGDTGLQTEMFHWCLTDNGYSSSYVKFWPTFQLMDNRELFMEQPTEKLVLQCGYLGCAVAAFLIESISVM